MRENYGFFYDTWNVVAAEAIQKGSLHLWSNYRMVFEHYKLRYGEQSIAKRRRLNEDLQESQGEGPKLQPSLSLFEELKQMEVVDMQKLGINPSLQSGGHVRVNVEEEFKMECGLCNEAFKEDNF